MKKPPEGYEFFKEKHDRYLRTKEGEVVSHLSLFEFTDMDFNWMLITDVDTKEGHREKGCAAFLIEEAFEETKKRNKGTYLMVKQDNSYAIRFYTNLGFENIRSCTLGDGDYFVFAKGNANREELLKANFGSV